MNKAMVFGAGGWLGERLTERLVAQGREVLAVDLRIGEDLRRKPGVEAVETDIRAMSVLRARLPECSAVFNCAGVLHPKKTQVIYAVNRDAPVELYRACLEHGVAAFVHVSSINAQGANPSPTTFLYEDTPLRPFTHYGRSKAEADRALQAMVTPGATRLILLRPGVFYGTRPSRNLLELLSKLRSSRVPYFSKQGFLRTYVDVEKVVDALVLGEHRGTSGQAYLIGDEEPMSTQRFYAVLCAELGVPARTIRLPASVAHLSEWAAMTAGKFNMHLRLPTIVGEFGRNVFCSVEKAKRELGFQPHFSSEPGLQAMVRSVHSS